MYHVLQEPLEQTFTEKVASLIDKHTLRWDIEKVQKMLPPSAVAKFFKIILPSKPREDQKIWELERRGSYSVRSAYRLCKELGKSRNDGECPTSVNQTRYWKKLRQLKIPNKIKIYIQRACKNSLPTKQNLKQKRIILESSIKQNLKQKQIIPEDDCPFYSVAHEDI